MSKDSISSYGEKALIERIINASIKRSSTVNNTYLNRIGDDCSVIRYLDRYLITTSDMLIRSHHFPDEMTYYDMGFKSVTVNVSDLASMGAKPLGFLLSIGFNGDLSIDDFDDFIDGVLSACDYYNIPLLGGDTNDSEDIIVCGTAIGETSDEPMMKYGFNKGDLVCITGKLGLAALGFQLLNQEVSSDNITITESINKALKPNARLNEGEKLLSLGVKTATDITDGLASELESLLEADKKYSNSINGNVPYNKGIRIYENKIPVDREYLTIVDSLNLDLYELLFHTGEDFELIFIMPRDLKSEIEKYLDFYVIGEVTLNNTLEIVLTNNEIKTLSGMGYEHFKL